MSEGKPNRPPARLVARPLLAGALAAVAGASLPAAADTYLTLTGIEGESNNAKFKDAIDILSYTQAFRNNFSLTSGGLATGKAQCGDITVTKLLDKSSPQLIGAVVTGKVISEAKLVFVRAGKEQISYYTVTVNDVQLASIEQTDQSASSVIVERLSLRGAKFAYEYRPQKPDGTLADPITFKWDCLQQKAP
jgi:type VI secretion system secreted protein Hcp